MNPLETILTALLGDIPQPLQSTLRAWLPAYDALPTFAWDDLRAYQPSIAQHLATRADAIGRLESPLLARLYLLAGDLESASELLPVAMVVLEHSADFTAPHHFVQPFYDQRDGMSVAGQFRVTYQLAYNHRGSQDIALKANLLQAAYELAQQAGDDRFLVQSTRTLGEYHLRYGKIHEAMSLLQLSLHHAHLLQDGYETATTFMVLALAHWHKDERDEALQYNLNAYHIFRRLGQHDRVVVALMNMGEISAQVGNLPQAERYLLEAINMQRVATTRPYYRGHAWRFLSHVYILQDRLSDADNALQQARFHMIENDDQRGLLNLHANEGLLALRRGDPAQAVQIWRTALDDGHDTLVAVTKFVLTADMPAAYIALGNRHEALAALAALCKMIQDLPTDHWQTQLTLIAFGYVLWFDKDLAVLAQLIGSIERVLHDDLDVVDALNWLKQTAHAELQDQTSDSPLDLGLLLSALKNRFGLL